MKGTASLALAAMLAVFLPACVALAQPRNTPAGAPAFLIAVVVQPNARVLEACGDEGPLGGCVTMLPAARMCQIRISRRLSAIERAGLEALLRPRCLAAAAIN